jgi:S-adenosyl-L-methionine hydrolase (adenosine-forming)
MRIVTLLTDFGLDDYYVGAVRGTLLRLSGDPPPVLVDLTHSLPPGDVEAAAHVLAAAVPSFPPETVHLAVVDPGVGTDRRILAAHGPAGRFVAPDNGLLHHLLPELTVHRVDRTELFEERSTTFHGRDRFAPVAAALVRGESFETLGPVIGDPVRLGLPAPTRSGDHRRGAADGRVAHVDRYGNLVTDLPASWLPAGVPVRIELAGRAVTRWVRAYRELPPGEAGALVGSQDTVELSLDGRSLAEAWGVGRGAPVTLRWPA